MTTPTLASLPALIEGAELPERAVAFFCTKCQNNGTTDRMAGPSADVSCPRCGYSVFTEFKDYTADQLRASLKAAADLVRAALAGQEPTAWIDHATGNTINAEKKAAFLKRGHKVDLAIANCYEQPLFASPPSVAALPEVPAGWRLVPSQSTEAMWRAGGLAAKRLYEGRDDNIHDVRSVAVIWNAMLSVAPTAPTQGGPR